jgi:hypothetical protein
VNHAPESRKDLELMRVWRLFDQGSKAGRVQVGGGIYCAASPELPASHERAQCGARCSRMTMRRPCSF